MAKTLSDGPVSCEKVPHTVTFDEDEVKGLKGLTVDEKATLSLKIKVVKIGRSLYQDGKPVEVEVEILSGGVSDSSLAKIEKAGSMKELEEAAKDVPKE